MQTVPRTRPKPPPPPPPAQVETVAIKPSLNSLNILPPIEYDKPYDGKIVMVTAASKEHLRLMCGNTIETNRLGIGCALLNRTTSVCRIIVAPEADIIAAGYSLKLVIRHENGHCQSWSGKHEGSRMATEKDF